MNIVKSAWEHLHDHFVPNARNSYQPHLVAHRSLHLYAAFLVSLKLATLFSLDLLPAGQAFSSAVTVRNILELTNYSRQNYGLTQLSENVLLDKAAQAKAEDMAKQQYFAHNSPQGLSPWDFIKAAGYNYMIAGENLAINFYSAEGVSDAWMNSPEHKANILNKDFKDIGIGISQGQYKGVNAIWVVQMFGTSTDRPFTPVSGFTTPKPLPQTPQNLVLPIPTKIALAKPVLNDPGFVLTNKKQLFVSGQAQGAVSVYVLDNRRPREELTASDGTFYGNINLDSGTNSISVVAFDDQAQSSPVSDSIQVKLDDAAPKIISSVITPQQVNGKINYQLQVQTQGDPVKIIAKAGAESIMLQQTANPNVWSGVIPGDSTMVKNAVIVSAYDLAGNVVSTSVANFATSTQSNFGFLASPQKQSVQAFGKTLNINSINNIYAYFVIALLAIMIITIAVRRNVRHVGMIAHASAMIALAMVFWVR